MQHWGHEYCTLKEGRIIQRIIKATVELNSTTEQMDPRETHGTSHPTRTESIFFLKCIENIL